LYIVLALLTAAAVALTQLVSGPTVVVAGAFGAAWALFLSGRLPELCFRGGFYLFLVGGTEFRVRDALAGVQGSVDTQIAFELAMYAFVAWVTLRQLVRLPRASWRLNTFESLLVAYVTLAAASALWSALPDQTQLLQTMARDLASLERSIEQLKANQQQIASDNSKAIEELKASQEEIKRVLAKVSEQNPPRTSPPPAQPAPTVRKPERTPQARARPRYPREWMYDDW
jgi:hypothetical protein